jgi:hypothetical protein
MLTLSRLRRRPRIISALAAVIGATLLLVIAGPVSPARADVIVEVKIQNKATGQCLYQDLHSGGTTTYAVYGGSCSNTGNNYNWNIAGQNNGIANMATGMYLTGGSQAGYRVQAKPYGGWKSQEWYRGVNSYDGYSSNYFANAATGLLLDSDDAGNVYTWTATYGDSNESWYYL